MTGADVDIDLPNGGAQSRAWHPRVAYCGDRAKCGPDLLKFDHSVPDPLQSSISQMKQKSIAIDVWYLLRFW